MDKEMQDKLWTSLPKEARIWIRKEYRDILNKLWQRSAYLRGRLRMMRDIYGEHNLTSDTEPEEVLTILRKDIIEEFNQATADLSRTGNLEYKGKRELLKNLFGDKCLPDKLIPSDSTELKSKFKLNEIVRVTSYDKYGVVGRIIKVDEEDDRFFYTLEGVSDWRFVEKNLEPYTEENKEPMEKKELNLCELLKGCEKHKFYSPMLSNAFIVQIREASIHIIPCDEEHGERFLFIDKSGVWTKGGQCVLYPSRALYEKYPLDAYSAWMEWQSERKPKRWRAKSSAGVAVSECEGHWDDYSYWYITSDGVIAQDEETNCKADNLRYNLGNYFRTEELAKQAAEAVRETLAKFHENHSEQ
ncbi:MAG: hypothetical protein K2M59_03765 [Muribaculaceae bacterium]|nr:hypothetical protein [Muribaculaceae bacterium]MDE7465527.1 hypothetical protein [Muribaculaceae bacterium]